MNLPENNLGEVLHSSLEMLKEKPVLFLPKLLSSGIGSFWFIGFLENYGSNIHYIISMPFLIFMSVIVSVLVSGMVKGINQGVERPFRFALKEIRSRITTLVGTSLLLLVVTFLMSIPMSVGVFLYFTTGSIAAIVIGLLITLVLSIGFGFVIYFLPATLVDKDSTIDAFKQSFRSSNENRADVTKLIIFSFGLLIVASASSGIGQTLGYIGFVLGRLVSSIVSTYLYVVSPKYYFSD